MPTNIDKKMCVYTDGGARGNPGPAALGVAFFNISGDLIAKFGKFLGSQTNNYAEYSAIIFALEQAKKMHIDELLCYLDSELVVRQLKGQYRVKNKGLQPLFRKVQMLAQDFKEISFEHVPRAKNKVADAVLNQVLDQNS